MSSLGLRTILVFALARFLSVSEIGTYGLILGFLTFAVYFAGFDFYTYSSREVIRDDGGEWASFVKSQFTFYGATICLTLVLMVAFAPLDFVPLTVTVWICVLLPFEHLGQELDRLLIAMGRQTSASIYLFIRQAVMPMIVLPTMAVSPEFRTLDFVLAAWLLFNGLGVLLAVLELRKILHSNQVGAISIRWIRAGIRASIPFLVGTLCLRALFTFDRQLVQSFSGLETLGVYTVFMAVGNGMSSLVSVAVHQFLYPGLVRAAHRGDAQGFRLGVRKVLAQTLGVVVGVAALAIVGLPAFLAVIDRPQYSEATWMLWWILAAMGLYNISLVPHLVLYSLDRDRTILAATVGALGMFGLVAGLGAPQHGAGAVLAGLAAASLWLVASKTPLALQAFRRSARAWRGDDLGGLGRHAPTRAET